MFRSPVSHGRESIEGTLVRHEENPAMIPPDIVRALQSLWSATYCRLRAMRGEARLGPPAVEPESMAYSTAPSKHDGETEKGLSMMPWPPPYAVDARLPTSATA